jgi:hypothetical protein
MLIREYRDFVLVADNPELSAEDEITKVTISVFDSPVGQGEQKETVAVAQSVLQMVRWLGARNLDQNLDQQLELGKALAAILLPPYARRLFAESLRSIRADEGLRLRLRFDDRLSDLPWEFAYIGDTQESKSANGFLVLDPRISIVRHEAIAVPGDWFEAPARRRILIAMASPKPFEKYPELRSLPDEQRSIKQALGKVEGVEAVFLPAYPDTDNNNETRGVTVEQLGKALTERTDVFHFSGHGEFFPGLATGEGRGILVFADNANNAFPVSSEKLAEILKSKGVRLVVLGACEGGRRAGRNVWGSVATALLRVGIPAVVAMQFTIQDKLAGAFVAAFYRALVAGCSIDEAVSTGRTAIRIEALNGQEDIRDWGVPVLYLRSPGGSIFKPVRDPQIAEQASRQTALLVEQRVREIASTGRVIGAEIETLTPGEEITISQKIAQEAKGFVLGARLFRLEGGHLTVKTEVDIVSGTMIGLQIGGRRRDATSELEDFLRAK